ncbi:MAG: enoyl-CoA hydratase-related protein [Rhodospirillaceae bacterium]
MSKDVVLKENNGNGVVAITLNRPEIFNGYNEALLTRVVEVVAEIDADDSVRAVLLRGAGKHFSAGADVNWFKELAAAPREEQVRAAGLSTAAMRALDACAKPTIALVQNVCFGGGVGYAAACDIVIASEDAKFAITEVRVGITPAPILAQCIKALGVRQIRRYALTAETFDAHQAKELGLVHEICPVGGLDDAVAPILDAIMHGGPNAIRDTKALITEISRTGMDDSTAARLSEASATGRASEEGKEGFGAFLEKRKPSWYNPQ